MNQKALGLGPFLGAEMLDSSRHRALGSLHWEWMVNWPNVEAVVAAGAPPDNKRSFVYQSFYQPVPNVGG